MENNILDDPMFQNLSPLKKTVVAELLEKAADTPLDKAFPLLLNASVTLNKHNESFTKKERDLLVTEITKKLSPEERRKIAALLKLL